MPEPLTVETLTAAVEAAIREQAATFEVQFDAGPGEVVGVPDAAFVAARAVLNLIGDRYVPRAEHERMAAENLTLAVKLRHLRAAVLHLAQQWERLAKQRALLARRSELERCAAELRALTGQETP